eukprot:Sdes_comp24101_c0_seq1m22151
MNFDPNNSSKKKKKRVLEDLQWDEATCSFEKNFKRTRDVDPESFEEQKISLLKSLTNFEISQNHFRVLVFLKENGGHSPLKDLRSKVWRTISHDDAFLNNRHLFRKTNDKCTNDPIIKLTSIGKNIHWIYFAILKAVSTSPDPLTMMKLRRRVCVWKKAENDSIFMTFVEDLQRAGLLLLNY